MPEQLDIDPQSEEARVARRNLLDLGAAYLGASVGDHEAYHRQLETEARRLGAVELGTRSRELIFAIDAASLIVAAAATALAGLLGEETSAAMHRLERGIDNVIEASS